MRDYVPLLDATPGFWKRTASFIIYHTDGTKRIADNALVAITLLIGESPPQGKDLLNVSW
jgi:hypothetical protein